MSTQPIQSNAGSGVSTNGAGTSSSTGVDNSLSNQQTFITLLVAQLQNQDPMDPADGVQFLTQLAEINNVQQLVAIHQDTDSMVQELSTPASGDNSGAAGSAGSGTAAAGQAQER